MRKKPLLNKIKRLTKLVYLKLFRINDSPLKIALGFGPWRANSGPSDISIICYSSGGDSVSVRKGYRKRDLREKKSILSKETKKPRPKTLEKPRYLWYKNMCLAWFEPPFLGKCPAFILDIL